MLTVFELGDGVDESRALLATETGGAELVGGADDAA